MIKNYKMLKKLEIEYNTQSNLSLEKRLELLNEMFIFARKFERSITDSEKSPHVQMLVKLTGLFKKAQQKLKNNAQ